MNISRLLVLCLLATNTAIAQTLDAFSDTSFELSDCVCDCDSCSPGCGTYVQNPYETFALERYSLYPRLLMDTKRCSCGSAVADTQECTTCPQQYAAQSGAVLAASYVATACASENLLPPPNDANDLFHSQLNYTEERLPDGTKPLVYSYFVGNDGATKDLWSRFKLLPSFGFFYDTGFVGGEFNVASIALGDSPRAGQTTFVGENDLQNVPVSALIDNQFLDALFHSGNQVQIFLELNNHERFDKVRLAHLVARVWNLDRINLGAGKTYSLFGVGGALPATLSQASTLVGTGEFTDSNKRKQLRAQVTPNKSGWGWGVAVEDPFKGDFDVPAGGVLLTRWPSFTGNLVYKGSNDVDRVQLSTLVRTLGFQGGTNEFFETGWGLSAYAMLGSIVEEKTLQGLYLGVAGGEGIGGYINGVQRSMAFTGTDLEALGNVGAYVGFKHQWLNDQNVALGINAAYGYAHMETIPTLDSSISEKLQQAWANILWYPSRNVAVGTEYQFGRRETIGDGDGENHRMMLVVGLTTAPPKPKSGSYRTDFTPSEVVSQSGQGLAARQTF